MDSYKEVIEELERSYRATETADQFLREILRIWTEYGLLDGEWSCTVVEKEAI